jgi:Domain of unknown function (DUF4412)
MKRKPFRSISIKRELIPSSLFIFCDCLGFFINFDFNMKFQQVKNAILVALFSIAAVAQAQPGMAGFSSNCDIKPTYSFESSMEVKMNVKAGKEDEMEMKMIMNVNNAAGMMGMKMKSDENPMLDGMNTLISMKDSLVIMLMDFGGQKKGMCMDMNSEEFKKQVEKQKSEAPDFSKFTKTGATKVILGYSCEEYTFKNETTNMSMWMTNEVKSLFDPSLGAYSGPSGVQLPEGMDGQWLAMTMVNSKDKTTVDAEVTAIYPNKKSEVSTAGYNFK